MKKVTKKGRKEAAATKAHRNRQLLDSSFEKEPLFVPDFSLLKPPPTDLELALIAASLYSLIPEAKRETLWSSASRIDAISNRL